MYARLMLGAAVAACWASQAGAAEIAQGNPVVPITRAMGDTRDQACPGSSGAHPCTHEWKRCRMAAMKPRTGDGPLEVTKEGRGIVMRVPLEGGGRLVVELNADEATALGDALKGVVG